MESVKTYGNVKCIRPWLTNNPRKRTLVQDGRRNWQEFARAAYPLRSSQLVLNVSHEIHVRCNKQSDVNM